MSQWKRKVGSDVSCTISKALKRYHHVPGSNLMAKLSIVIASKLGTLGYDGGEYEDELDNLALPISETEKSFNRSNHAGYGASERRQLTVLIMHKQFRVPKAQLVRMLQGKQQKRDPMDEQKQLTNSSLARKALLEKRQWQ